jgi:hypothetical protein
MKKLLFLAITVLVIATSCTKTKYQTVTKTDANGYTYEMVTNDPTT